MNPTSLLNWWPQINDLGIPMPRTEIVLIGEAASTLLSSARDDGSLRLEHYADALHEAARKIGFPLFLRTDLVSGKHLYKQTCMVSADGDLMNHVASVVMEHEVAMFLEPDGIVEALVLRELLPLDARFTAFMGLPIAAERRYFVAGGEVQCHHPYWPAEALQWWGEPHPVHWRDNLRDLNRQPAREVRLLTDYAKRVGEQMTGAWSVDFARTREGVWYLIDMAEEELSWHPPCRKSGA